MAMVATALSASDADGIASGPIVNSATSAIAIATHGKQKFLNKSRVASQMGNPGIFNDGTGIDPWQATSNADDVFDIPNRKLLRAIRHGGRSIAIEL